LAVSVEKWSNYTAFGSPMPGRKFLSGDKYRYGFQKQEEDQELWGGAVFFKYRVEDPRLGRFFSSDPLEKEYPYYSPYAFSGNRVIDATEREGLEPNPLNYMVEGFRQYFEAGLSKISAALSITESTEVSLETKAGSVSTSSSRTTTYGVNLGAVYSYHGNNNVNFSSALTKTDESTTEVTTTVDIQGGPINGNVSVSKDNKGSTTTEVKAKVSTGVLNGGGKASVTTNADGSSSAKVQTNVGASVTAGGTGVSASAYYSAGASTSSGGTTTANTSVGVSATASQSKSTKTTTGGTVKVKESVTVKASVTITQ